VIFGYVEQGVLLGEKPIIKHLYFTSDNGIMWFEKALHIRTLPNTSSPISYL